MWLEIDKRFFLYSLEFITVSEFWEILQEMNMNTVEFITEQISIEIHARIGSFKHYCTIGYCILYSWDLKFVGKVIHENNENWIPKNKKYFTVHVAQINTLQWSDGIFFLIYYITF